MVIDLEKLDESEKIVYGFYFNISDDPNDDIEMNIIEGYREEAVEEIEKVKNTGDIKKAQHLMDILKKSDDFFNEQKESIKKVFKDDKGVMESIENIEKEIKKMNYRISWYNKKRELKGSLFLFLIQGPTWRYRLFQKPYRYARK